MTSWTRKKVLQAHRNEGRSKKHGGLGVASAISISEWGEDALAWYNREEVDLNDFKDDGDYTGSQLDAYADAILRKDSKEKPIGVYPQILFEEHLYNRRRREILCAQGFPDEALTQTLSRDGQMIYGRTHPQGRKVNTKEARAAGASYFK